MLHPLLCYSTSLCHDATPPYHAAPLTMPHPLTRYETCDLKHPTAPCTVSGRLYKDQARASPPVAAALPPPCRRPLALLPSRRPVVPAHISTSSPPPLHLLSTSSPPHLHRISTSSSAARRCLSQASAQWRCASEPSRSRTPTSASSSRSTAWWASPRAGATAQSKCLRPHLGPPGRAPGGSDWGDTLSRSG